MSKFAHEVIIETTNCTGISCSRRWKESKMETWWENKRKKKKKN